MHVSKIKLAALLAKKLRASFDTAFGNEKIGDVANARLDDTNHGQ